MSNHKKRTLAEFPDLMLDWDPLNNSGIRPEDLTSGSHQVVVWTCHKCGRRWSCQVRNRIQGTGCTCDAMARKTASLRKKLVARDGSLAEHRPDLAAQWHPTKNGSLKPEYIPYGSNKRLWWKCTQCGYEWQSPVASRTRGTRCPVCTGNTAAEGINDLCTTHPDLVKEWNFGKNKDLSPKHYSAGSGKYVWWVCSACGFEWQAAISNRTRNRNCPPLHRKGNHTGKIAGANLPTPRAAVVFSVRRTHSQTSTSSLIKSVVAVLRRAYLERRDIQPGPGKRLSLLRKQADSARL